MLNHVGVLEPDHPRPDPQMHYYIFINFRALADFPIKLITQRQITCPRRGTTHQTSQKCSPCISGNFDKTTMKISVHYLGPLNCPNNSFDLCFHDQFVPRSIPYTEAMFSENFREIFRKRTRLQCMRFGLVLMRALVWPDPQGSRNSQIYLLGPSLPRRSLRARPNAKY